MTSIGNKKVLTGDSDSGIAEVKGLLKKKIEMKDLQGPVPFFAFSAKIGRRALRRLQERAPMRDQSWYARGIFLIFLYSFWQALWANWKPCRISFFLWLIAHGGLPVGSLLIQMDHNRDCQICLLRRMIETTKHCLWGYTRAQEI